MRSRNEVEAMAFKAARGAGVPLGHAEDFARAVGFLGVSDAASLGCVTEALSVGRVTTHIRDGVLHVTPAHPVMAAPMVIDAMTAEVTEAQLHDLIAPALWHAYLAVAAQDRGVFLARTGTKITRCDPFDVSVPRDTVVVAADDWSAWSALAARTFVPATAASRLAGAGAGLTDND